MPMIKLYKEKSKSSHVNKFIVPFAYGIVNEVGFEQTVLSLCNTQDGKWSVKEPLFDNNELYEHISSLIPGEISLSNEGGNNSIAYMLKMNREHETFPSLCFTSKKLSNTATIQIKDIDLFLFRTGIGFLTITLNYDQVEYLEDIIEANFQFKAIKHSELYTYENQKKDILLKEITITESDLSKCYEAFNTQDKEHPYYISKEIVGIEKDFIDDIRLITVNQEKLVRVSYHTISAEPFEFKRLVNELLSELSIDTFFNQHTSNSLNTKCTSKANIFSAVMIPESDMEQEETKKMFFRLRHGYSRNYNMDSNACIDRSVEIYRPFCESIWGITREGTANLICPGNEFIKNEYLNRIDTYFTLYIIALHQYYGLLYLAQKISYLPVELEDYSDLKYHKALTKIRHECNIFYLKCMFDEVSHITHQAIYYERLIEVLGIKRMQLEINYEMEHIAAIVEQIHLKKAAKEKEEKDSRDQKVQFIMSFAGVIFSIIAFVATFDDALSFWTNVGSVNAYFSGYELINAVITMVVLLLIILVAFAIMIHMINRKESSDSRNNRECEL